MRPSPLDEGSFSHRQNRTIQPQTSGQCSSSRSLPKRRFDDHRRQNRTSLPSRCDAAQWAAQVGVCLNADLTIIAVKIAPLAMRRRRCYPCSSCAVPNPAEFCKRLGRYPKAQWGRTLLYSRPRHRPWVPALAEALSLASPERPPGPDSQFPVKAGACGSCVAVRLHIARVRVPPRDLTG